jgi:uncharacterized repeat protein (TIGR03803 family)
MKTLLIYLLFTSVTTYWSFSQHNTKLWSTNSAGGSDGLGSIFSFDPNASTYTREYGFPAEMPGSRPWGNGFVDIGTDTLYTSIYRGGAYSDGIIAAYDPANDSYFRLLDFSDSTGSGPRTKLTYHNNTLFGTTQFGGTYGKGTIFDFNPHTKVFTKRYDFQTAISGGSNSSGLIFYNGKFYGCNNSGGSNNYGTLFEFDPVTNNLTVLVHFAGAAAGGNPSGTPVIVGNKIIGTTSNGGISDGGTIYEYDLSTGVFTKKFNFVNATTGTNPEGALVELNGFIYGTCPDGGTGTGPGSIFKYDPVTEVCTQEFGFNNTLTGRRPHVGLIYNNNKFYGITSEGGLNNSGGIFEWDPITGVFMVKTEFGTLPYPWPSASRNPICVYNGVIYGLCDISTGTNGYIAKYNLSTNSLTKSQNFNTSLGGATPRGGLIEHNGKYYGLTEKGGQYNLGVLYEFDPNTGVYSKKFDFNGATNGSNPKGALSEFNGKLYGITYDGGSGGSGVIFEYNPVTNVFTKKLDINTSLHGSFCYGNLVLFQNNFYALLSDAPGSIEGSIIRWNPVTNVCTKMQDFVSPNGRFPYCSLVIKNNKLYGMTSSGGNSYFSDGVMFVYDPIANIKSTFFHFDDDLNGTGGKPQNSLTVVGNDLWGLTSSGGTGGGGVIFKYRNVPANYTVKYNLDDTLDGSLSRSTMTFIDGKLYGMCTRNGAITSPGTLFSFDTLTNVFTKLHSFNVVGGMNPEGDFLTTISNNAPILSNLPSTQNHCSIANGSVTFNYFDNDGDIPSYVASSSNTSLIANNNISVSFVSGSIYNVVYTPQSGQSGNTTITIQVNDGFGSIQQISFDVVIDFPIVNLGPDIVQCGGSLSLNANVPALTYEWNTGETAQSIDVLSSGQFVVEVTDLNSCTDSDTINITINSLPSVNLGSDIVQCGGSVNLNGQNSGQTYLWNTFQTLETINVTTSGSYFVEVTDGNACSNSDTILVTINTVPNVNLGGTINHCGDTVILDALNTGSTYLWNDNSVNQTFTVYSSGLYSVTVTNAFGCSGMDDVQVNINPLPAVSFVLLTMNDSICIDGSTFSLNGGLPSGGIYSGNGVVSGNNFNPSSAAAGNHEITYTYVDGNGCSNSDSQEIVVLANPIVQAFGTSSICLGETVNLTASGASTYSWNNGAGTGSSVSVSPSLTTTYTVTGTDAFGCQGVNLVTITVKPQPDISVGVNEVTLSANNSTSGVTYQWIDCNNANAPLNGETSKDFTVSINGNYAVIVTQNGCSDTSQCYTIDYVGMDELLNSQVNVYPNPTSSSITIDLGDSFIGSSLIQILNPAGKVIYQESITSTQKEVDLSHFSVGLYFIKVENQSQQVLNRIVKE